MGSFTDRLRHAWNAFKENDSFRGYRDLGSAFSYRPDRHRMSPGNDRSIVNAVISRMANDAASLTIEHCRVDEYGKYLSSVDSGLNYCLNVEANLDQTGRAFRFDMFMSLLDEGCIAIVPTDATLNPKIGSFDITSMRIGKITQWFPEYVTVRLYNQKNGQQEEVTLPKRIVAIVENPFYTVMNESSSTLKRLIRKMNLLDRVDEQIGSQKLDLIIQLPYVTKGETRKRQAEIRRKAITDQLVGSEYGIAYIDGTEHVTQLNRPVENNLTAQVESLTSMLYGQLGITAEIMNGTAGEAEMNNYYSRTIEPIVTASIDEMKRKFITKNARTRGQSLIFFRDPFKLMPTSSIADVAEKLTRNEVMTPNEIRQIVGLKPAEDPSADELRNRNMYEDGPEQLPENISGMSLEEYQAQMAELQGLDAELDELSASVGG